METIYNYAHQLWQALNPGQVFNETSGQQVQTGTPDPWANIWGSLDWIWGDPSQDPAGQPAGKVQKSGSGTLIIVGILIIIGILFNSQK